MVPAPDGWWVMNWLAGAIPERCHRPSHRTPGSGIPSHRFGAVAVLCIFLHSLKPVTVIIMVWRRWATALIPVRRRRGQRPEGRGFPPTPCGCPGVPERLAVDGSTRPLVVDSPCPRRRPQLSGSRPWPVPEVRAVVHGQPGPCPPARTRRSACRTGIEPWYSRRPAPVARISRRRSARGRRRSRDAIHRSRWTRG
jgi:hypothetical protein